MNKQVVNKTHSAIRFLTLGLSAMVIISCADSGVVVMEAAVTQLNDLQDHDRDGVIEAREKCANTVLGASIDNYGCGTQRAVVEPLKVDIKFAHDSYVIEDSAYPEIQKLVNFLEKSPNLKVLIEGHTSRVGSAMINQKLSDERAKAIASMLINDFSIDAQRVSSMGYGFTRLAEEGDSDEAHAANRRIMAELSHVVHVDDMLWTIYSVDQVQ
jgi:OOP family OmpA-OmpF porin